jgi:hypothetical protein
MTDHAKAAKMVAPPHDNQLDSMVCSRVVRAITLEKKYNGTLLQGDEIGHRIQLWREAIELCIPDSEGAPRMCDSCA